MKKIVEHMLIGFDLIEKEKRCVTDANDCYFDLSLSNTNELENDTHPSIDNVYTGDCPTLVYLFRRQTCAAFDTLISRVFFIGIVIYFSSIT